MKAPDRGFFLTVSERNQHLYENIVSLPNKKKRRTAKRLCVNDKRERASFVEIFS